MKLCILWLTCADQTEADKISRALLSQKLVACIKKVPVSSSFLWEGKINDSEEVLLMMDSKEELFSAVETEIRKHHSYDSFVLLSVPVKQASRGIAKWINQSLRRQK